VIGPKKLPELARSLGHGVREFRETISGEHDAASPRGKDRVEVTEAEDHEPAETGDHHTSATEAADHATAAEREATEHRS